MADWLHVAASHLMRASNLGVAQIWGSGIYADESQVTIMDSIIANCSAITEGYAALGEDTKASIDFWLSKKSEVRVQQASPPATFFLAVGRRLIRMYVEHIALDRCMAVD